MFQLLSGHSAHRSRDGRKTRSRVRNELPGANRPMDRKAAHKVPAARFRKHACLERLESNHRPVTRSSGTRRKTAEWIDDSVKRASDSRRWFPQGRSLWFESSADKA